MATDEVTAADIARLAGVGRAAVSNWRARHKDFPQPVGGSRTSPTFVWSQVEAWLTANGRWGDEARRAEPSAGSDLGAVAASLLPTQTPDLVLDPATGGGAMLAAVARRFGAATTYVGQDPDRTRLDSARKRLAQAGVARAELFPGSPFGTDALERYRGAADVVVCLLSPKPAWPAGAPNPDLPWEFGSPGSTDPHLAWLQICYLYLKAGGTAVAATPPSAGVRGSGRRIRAEMLRTGALRQVVALPQDFAANLPSAWHIWVLHRPANRPQYTVRMVDLTELPRDEVPTDEAAWRRIYRDPTRCADVEAIELLDEDVLLVPSRHVEAPVRPVRPDYDRLRAELTKAAATLDAKLPALPAGSGQVPSNPVSVTDLVRLGAVTFVERGSEARPGDVIVPLAADRFDAFVVGADGRQRTRGEILRCDSELIDPYFLACFLRSESNRRHASGTLGGTSRLDLRRARIPRMTPAEQRQYGEVFRRLTEVTDRLERVSALASDAVQKAVYGLTSGVLAPPRGTTRSR